MSSTPTRRPAIEVRSSNPALFTYGKMTAIMAPRIIRIGARYEF